jgi:HSP20 family molecular chaperone IbpA
VTHAEIGPVDATMNRREMRSWMWAEAVDMLDQAERLQRQFFRLAGPPAADRQPPPRWEPPVDVYAGAEQALIEVALPGVPAERMELILGPGELVIRGERTLPNRPAGTTLQRLEIPYGRFERRLALGPGQWDLVDQRLTDGCLQLLLARR